MDLHCMLSKDHLDQLVSIWQCWNQLHLHNHAQLRIFTDPYSSIPFTTQFVHVTSGTGQSHHEDKSRHCAPIINTDAGTCHGNYRAN